MGWNDMEKARKEGGSAFIKLQDGDSIEGVFRGDPRGFYKKFKEQVEYPEWNEGLSFRFRINFIVKNDKGEYKAKILEGGAKLRDQLLDAKEEYTLDSVFKIKRKGSGKNDTRYAILFKNALTPDQLKAVNAVKSLSLESNKEDAELYDERNPPPQDDKDIPF